MNRVDSFLTGSDVPAMQVPTVPGAPTALHVAHLVGLRGLRTRSQLLQATDLGRAQVTGAWEQLMSLGVLVDDGTVSDGRRGQPAAAARLHPHLGLVVVVDCGASLARLLVCTLSREVLLRKTFPCSLARGPAHFMQTLAGELDEELARHIASHGPLRYFAIGVPARIDYSSGSPVRPTIMPGWDGVRLRNLVEEQYGCDAWVDNEVNLRVYAESLVAADSFPIIAVKVGWGIGAGIAVGPGQVLHGYSGAAGEIGHTPVPVHDGTDLRCRCGKLNCIEALASVGAVIGELYGDGPSADIDLEAQDRLVSELFSGDPTADAAVRRAGLRLGRNLANLCDTLNPRVISLDSVLNDATDALLSGLRTAVLEDARPLASRDVTIRMSTFGTDTGLVGGCCMAIAASLQMLTSATN